MAGRHREPRDRPCGTVAPDAAPRLLHDRLGGPRVERARCARPRADRPGPPPLPVRRLLPRAGGADRAGRGVGRPPRHGRGGRRADRRRAPQGLRPRGPRRGPADLDHRLAPSACRGDRLRDRARPGARRRVHLAARRGGRLLVRGRVAPPRDGAGGAQHHGAPRVRRHAASAAVRLRGQRPRDQRPDARGMGRAVAPRAAGARDRERARRATRRSCSRPPASSSRGCASTGIRRSSTFGPCAT